ncbi:MAG: hypothetical protein AABX03_03440 [Nanoarchaeota archaeon]
MENQENNQVSKEQVEEEIAELVTKIKNTEYDLTHSFKGNSLIEQKLVNSKKTLEEKKTLLSSLDEIKQKKFKEKEKEILEVNSSDISKDQEAFIEEQVEENM